MKPYKIKKSDIDKKGKGLYATRDIKEGEKIIDYIGKLREEKIQKIKEWIGIGVLVTVIVGFVFTMLYLYLSTRGYI